MTRTAATRIIPYPPAGPRGKRSNQEYDRPVLQVDLWLWPKKGTCPERKAAGLGDDLETTLVCSFMARKSYYCFEHQSVDEARQSCVNITFNICHSSVMSRKYDYIT